VRLYEEFWSKGFSVEAHFELPCVVEGDNNRLHEVIINRNILPLPMVRVKFASDKSFRFENSENISVSDRCYKNDIFSVSPYQKITRKVDFVCTHRGVFLIDQIDVIAANIFMQDYLVNYYSCDSFLTVYPRTVEYDRIKIPFNRMLGTVLTRRSLLSDPFEFGGIRQYQSYDSIRDVNWKATAKTGELKVNVYEHTTHQDVCIILDLDYDTLYPDDLLREESIRLAHTLARGFIQEGIPVHLYSNARDKLTSDVLAITAGCGSGHAQKIALGLARIDLEQAVDNIDSLFAHFPSRNENTLFILISSSQKSELVLRYSEICAQSSGSAWLLPYRKFLDEIKIDPKFVYLIPWEVN